MREQREVQRAHDLFHAIIVAEVRLNVSDADRRLHHAVHDVLSWVLRGHCGDVFEKNLTMLRAKVRESGFVEYEL